MYVIPIHFNVDEHHLALDQFIIAAKSTEAIVEGFNQQLFGGKLEYQLVVLPPEPGTFKEKFGLITCSAGFLLAAISPELLSGMAKEITGKSIFEIGQELGKPITNLIEFTKQELDENFTSHFVGEMTVGFYQKPDNELEAVGITKQAYTKSYEGRNTFYETCYRNNEIKGIGFDDTDNFPIQRNDFARFIVQLPEKEEDDDNDNWEVEITFIKVISPNWERGDNRTWKARYDKSKEAYFTIEDEEFWALVEAEKLNLKGRDSIKVQWAYILEGNKRKKVRVLKVLEYNGQELASPLEDDRLNELLHGHSKAEKEQPDLFD